jgi:hypothetical protein
VMSDDAMRRWKFAVLSASWCGGMNPCNCAKTTGSNPVSLPQVSLGYRGLSSREVYPVLRISGHAYLIYAFLGIDKRWNEFGKLGFRRLGGLTRWLRPRGRDLDFLCPA